MFVHKYDKILIDKCISLVHFIFFYNNLKVSLALLNNHPEVLRALLNHPRGYTTSSLGCYLRDALQLLDKRDVDAPLSLRRAGNVYTDTGVVEVLLEHPDLNINYNVDKCRLRHLSDAFQPRISHNWDAVVPSTFLSYAISSARSKVVLLMLAHKKIELPIPKHVQVSDGEVVISPLVYAVLKRFGIMNLGSRPTNLAIVSSLLHDGRCDVFDDFDQIIRMVTAKDDGGDELSSKHFFLFEFLRFEANRVRHRLRLAKTVCESRGVPSEIYETCVRPCLLQSLVQPAHVKAILALKKVVAFRRKLVLFLDLFDDISKFDIPESYLKQMSSEQFKAVGTYQCDLHLKQLRSDLKQVKGFKKFPGRYLYPKRFTTI